MYEDWIDAKTKLSIEVISKEGDDSTRCKLNDKWHGAILHVNEIIQLYFNNLERTKSRDKKEWVTNDSADDDEKSYEYYSDSEDSTGMEYDDAYDFYCNNDIGIDSWHRESISTTQD